jgi:hypothetical protein
MTAVETIIFYGHKQFGKHKDNAEDSLTNDPELKFIVEAVEAYGRQEYNRALEAMHNLSKNKFVAGETGYIKQEDVDTMKL